MYQEFFFFAFLFFRYNQDFIPSMFSLEKWSVGSWVSREESCTSRAPKYKNLDSDPCSAVCKLIKLDHTFFLAFFTVDKILISKNVLSTFYLKDFARV